MRDITVSLVEQDGHSRPVTLPVTEVLLAGYTGRDRARVMEHIHELQALGVAPPDQVPTIYVVEPSLVTTDPTVSVRGTETSGEVEFWAAPSPDGLLVGVGSDHTDRRYEAIDVAVSKTLCPKVISREVWRYRDVKDHWDEVEIRSWVTDHAGRRIYQEGRLDAFMTLDNVLAAVRAAGYADIGQRIVFGGTLPTYEGFVYGRRFEAELRDPLLNRTLSVTYDVVTLPAS